MFACCEICGRRGSEFLKISADGKDSRDTFPQQQSTAWVKVGEAAHICRLQRLLRLPTFIPLPPTAVRHSAPWRSPGVMPHTQSLQQPSSKPEAHVITPPSPHALLPGGPNATFLGRCLICFSWSSLLGLLFINLPSADRICRSELIHRRALPVVGLQRLCKGNRIRELIYSDCASLCLDC